MESVSTVAAAAAGHELEVAMLWRDTLLDVQHFDGVSQVNVGSSSSNHFHLDLQQAGGSFPLVAFQADGCVVSRPQKKSVVLRREAPEQVRVDFDEIGFLVRWVERHELLEASIRTFDYGFSKILTASLLGGLALLWAIFMTDVNAESLSEDLFKNPQRFTRLMIKPPEKEMKKRLKDKLKEQPLREDPYARARVDDKLQFGAGKHESDRKKAMGSGLLAILGGGSAIGGADGSIANVFGGGGLGTNINQALGSLRDSSGISDSHGVGGMGTRGLGPGGAGGLGLGGLGTRGGGRGRGGHGGHGQGGYGAINLGSRGKSEIRVIPGKTIITGSCERAVIGPVIGRHANEIRYCYEMALGGDPNLAGKVSVSFTIDPAGTVSDATLAQSTLSNNSVEQCILTRVRRWKFPEPKGGGVCVINYPWVFKAAGTGGEGDNASIE
jgi:TonB family protein